MPSPFFRKEKEVLFRLKILLRRVLVIIEILCTLMSYATYILFFLIPDIALLFLGNIVTILIVMCMLPIQWIELKYHYLKHKSMLVFLISKF